MLKMQGKKSILAQKKRFVKICCCSKVTAKTVILTIFYPTLKMYTYIFYPLYDHLLLQFKHSLNVVDISSPPLVCFVNE